MADAPAADPFVFDRRSPMELLSVVHFERVEICDVTQRTEAAPKNGPIHETIAHTMYSASEDVSSGVSRGGLLCPSGSLGVSREALVGTHWSPIGLWSARGCPQRDHEASHGRVWGPRKGLEGGA